MHWTRWGPFLSERQWGNSSRGLQREWRCVGIIFPSYYAPVVVRTAGAKTGCSASATANRRLAFALSLWNTEDHILKERLFGLTGPQGNHGEDVKEVYFYLDSDPVQPLRT